MQLLALEHHRPRIQAERWLEQALRGEIQLEPMGWFDLTLLATGDKEKAQNAFNRAVKATWKKTSE